MAKILIDIKDSGFPKNEDIIAYNSSLKCWEVICKDQYLKTFRDEIKEMKENNEQMSKDIAQFTEDVNKQLKEMKTQIIEIAKITKEGLSNE